MAPPQSKKVKYNVEDIADDENFREIDFTENNIEKNNSEQSSDESEADVEQETTNKVAIENEKKVYQEKNPSETDDEVLNKKKRKRSQNKCLNCKQPGHLKRECPDLSEERRKELQDLVQMKVERKGERKLTLLLSVDNLFSSFSINLHLICIFLKVKALDGKRISKN